MLIDSNEDCLKCKNGYHVEGDDCEKNIKNCLEHTGSICDKCEERYSLNNSGSECEKPHEGVDNCIYYIDNLCTECKQGYYLTDYFNPFPICKKIPYENCLEASAFYN